MATQNDLGLVWAETGGVTDPGNAKYSQGWISEIPTYQNFNYVLQNTTANIAVKALQGQWDWQADLDYLKGAKVVKDGIAYMCLVDNTGINPSTDTDHWTKGFVLGDLPYTPLASHGLVLGNVNDRVGNRWDGSDVTIANSTPLVNFVTNNAGQKNWGLGNYAGNLCAFDFGTTINPDGSTLTPLKIYHEGFKPSVKDITDAIEEAPSDGKIYGRKDTGWVEVTTSTASEEPPPPVKGTGTVWYNLSDGQAYIDINDGDSSQWVPMNPPVVPESQLEQTMSTFAGMEVNFAPNTSPGSTFVRKDGRTLNRDTYPALWQKIVDGTLPSVPDAEWQEIKKRSENNSVSVYSTGNGTTTFRIPSVGTDGGFARSLGQNDFTPVGDIEAGFEDDFRAHDHYARAVAEPGKEGSAFAGTYSDKSKSNDGSFANNGTLSWGATNHGPYDSPATQQSNGHGLETTPKGFYVVTYIYTGMISGELPVPDPDWLAQQDTNTGEINELWDAVSNTNLLINGDFSIDQREFDGLITTSSTTYTLDRWYAFTLDKPVNVRSSGVASEELGINYSNCIKLEATEEAYAGIGQRVELLSTDYDFSKGVTLSFGARSGGEGIANIKQVLFAYHKTGDPEGTRIWDNAKVVNQEAGDEASGGSRITVTSLPPFPDYGAYGKLDYFEVIIYFEIPVNTTVSVVQAKLELGTKATKFFADNPAINLLKCQRYFVKSRVHVATWNYQAQSPRDTNPQDAEVYVPFPTAMRTWPAMTEVDGTVGASYQAIQVNYGAATGFSLRTTAMTDSGAPDKYYTYTADAEL